MQLEPYLAQVHDQLSAAVGLADGRTKEIAEQLAGVATPALRLAILGALSAAADEVTAALLDHPGSPSVSVHLDGDAARVVVHTSGAEAPTPEPRADETDASARISLRLSESLKSDIDTAAARDGVSVNTWLVRAATAALSPSPFAQLGAKLGGFAGGFGGPGGGFGGPGGFGGFGGSGGPGGNQQRLSGWIDG